MYCEHFESELYTSDVCRTCRYSHGRVQVLISLSCCLVQALILAADRVDGQAGTTPKKVGKRVLVHQREV